MACRWIKTLFCLLALCGPCMGMARAEEAFGISAALSETVAGELVLSIAVTMPDGYYLYADRFEVHVPEPVRLDPGTGPAPEKITDGLTGLAAEVYARDLRVEYLVSNLDSDTLAVTVFFQGCRRDLCFMPQSRTFVLKTTVAPDETAPESVIPPADVDEGDLPELLSGFTIMAKRPGYMNARDFLQFLDAAYGYGFLRCRVGGCRAQGAYAHRCPQYCRHSVSLVHFLSSCLAAALPYIVLTG